MSSLVAAKCEPPLLARVLTDQGSAKHKSLIAESLRHPIDVLWICYLFSPSICRSNEKQENNGGVKLGPRNCTDERKP